MTRARRAHGDPDARFWTNRRAHPRTRIERHEVFLEGDIGHGDDERRAETVEISRGGLVLLVDHDLPVGTDLRLRIQVPFKSVYIRARGRVLRASVAPDGRQRIAVQYATLLEGSDEALYDTLLDLIAPRP